MRRELSDSFLEEVACSTLETAAFALATVVSDPPDFGADDLETSLEFSGPEHGYVVLGARRPFARELAANMLGVEPEDPEAEASGEQALKELVNIVTGSLVVQLFGAREICHLGLPQVERFAERTPRGAPRLTTSLLVDEAHPLELLLYLDSGSPA